MENLYKVPVSEVSVGELIDTLKRELNMSKPKEYKYGINGLAEVLGCSRSQEINIKNSGILGKGIIQNGRKIVVDVELTLQNFNKKYK